MAHCQNVMQQLPHAIMHTAQVFSDAGYELSLVGGPVRDAFLGYAPKDFDLTTNAHPQEIEQLLRRAGASTWDIGRDFGTIGGHLQGCDIEITTYRTDQYTPRSRKPHIDYGKVLEGDLSRRDFTVNSMALRLPDFTLVDPHGGLQDLLEGVLDTPVNPTQSFDDDPLRMMRAARFCSQLGFDVSERVLTAIDQMKERLSIVSLERIQQEFYRLIIGMYPRRGIEMLVYTGLCDLVLPELSALQQTVDEHRRHKDVYEHTLTVLDQAIALETDDDGPVPRPDFILRFAAIMHDIGKPATRRFEGGGTVTFHQHDIVGARMTRKRMKHLRFDKKTIQAVSHLVALHLRFHGYGEQSWTDSAIRRYVADAGDQLQRLHRLTRADCTTRNQRKARYLSAAYDDLEHRIDEVAQKEELSKIRPDLNGEQIMHILGLSPGPEVGKAYKFLLDLRMTQGELGEEEAKKRLLAWWDAQ
ncbi:MAG: CCA tRNA nucleotidyltransferase [Actinomycetaceae bacterium]|nr:CCA tRNA nucleotidyltransferase [Actinomycetaceae bacterium]